jgi:hypothetical protein
VTALKAAATGQVAPEQARNPYEHLKRQLENSKGEFAKLVGSPANADKFIRVVLNAVLSNPRLLDVSSASHRRVHEGGAGRPDARRPRGGAEHLQPRRSRAVPWTGSLGERPSTCPWWAAYQEDVRQRRDHLRRRHRGLQGRRLQVPARRRAQAGTTSPLDYAQEDLDGEPIIIAAYAIVKLKNGESSAKS